MNTKLFNLFAVASAVLLLTLMGTVPTRAGTITVVSLPPTNTDIATGITTNKTYVSAFNYGSRNTTVYSVNGVPFAHVRTAVQNVFLSTNWIDTNPGHGGQVFVSVAAANGGVDVTSSTPPGTQSDGNMLNLFYDQIYPGSGQPINGYLQEVYSNLTIGDQYSLRIYYRVQTVGNANRLVNVWFNGEGTPQAYSANPLSLDANGANYIKYDFTASGTTVTMLMTNIIGGQGGTTFAATLENDSIPYAPFITYQPTAVVINGAGVFTMSAIGTPSLSYQWYTNSLNQYSGAAAASDGNDYSGSTTATLAATNNLLDYYFVVVTNNYGSITSSIAQVNPRPTIITQPVGSKAGGSIILSMTAGGFQPLYYQWYSNSISSYTGAAATGDGTDYSGSTTNNLAITNNLNDYYFVIVTNSYGSVTSSIVQAAPPLTVLSAGEPIWNQDSQSNVIVTFSAALDPTTSQTVGNYVLDPSAPISSAVLGASNEVVLKTSSALSGSYLLTVGNVKSYVGATMTPSPTNIAVGVYPANIALWVKANTAVTTDAYGVNEWDDQSGNANDFYGPSYLGEDSGPIYDPQLATNAWGDPVIRFTATNETQMLALSSPTLAITNDMSIIAVVNFAILGGGTGTNGEIVSKTSAAGNIPAPYDYYVKGNPLGGGSLYRGNGSAYGQVTATNVPFTGTPHILAVSETGNTISHYLDGAVAGTGALNNSFNESSCLDAGQSLYIGMRSDNVDRLTGDLAELIIVNSPISSYDIAQLTPYLVKEHNITIVNSNPTNVVFSATSTNLTLSWPSDHTGWELQVQTNSLAVGISTNWSAISNSTTTNQVIIPINLTNGSVFYRLVYPAQ